MNFVDQFFTFLIKGRELVILSITGLCKVINNIVVTINILIFVSAHWLSIEGLQPAIPENPPPGNEKECGGFIEQHLASSAKLY